MIIVLAGTVESFENWRPYPRSECVVITPDTTRRYGLRVSLDDRVIMLGTFWQHKHAGRCWDEFRATLAKTGYPEASIEHTA